MKPSAGDGRSMMRLGAFSMIRHHFDHPAFRDASVTATLHHAGQLTLESLQAADALIDFGTARFGDGVGGGAGLRGVVLQR